MTWRLVALLAMFCLAANAFGAGSDWVIREDGVGPAKVGMTLAQLRAALHDRLIDDGDSGSEGCEYVKPTKHPHVSFMILDGHFVRADVAVRGIATSDGIQVGDSESDVRRRYGPKMTVEPHQYIDDGHYLTLRSADGKYGVRFETEKGKVIDFYAGRFSAIQYVEGCE